MGTQEYNNLTLLLGELKGQLSSVSELIRHSNQATHQRIDDLARKVDAQTAATNTRINDHKAEVDERFDEQNRRIRQLERELHGQRNRGRLESAGIATAVPAMIEVIKALTRS